MQLSDLLIERSYHLKQLRKWKFVALLLIAIIVGYFFLYKSNMTMPAPTLVDKSKDYIALIRIENILTENPKTDELFHRVEEDEKAKALIVYINTPGGTSTSGEQIYYHIQKVKRKKPVIAVMGTMATSAGYLVALAADHIIAYHMTITGSIGTIVQSAEIIDLAEKIGVKFKNFKSSPLKATPNPMEPLTPEIERATMSVINDSYNYFVDLVVQNRNIPRDEALLLADGRIYTGRQALENKLIDALGTIEDAPIWLQDHKNVSKELKIKEVRRKKHEDFFQRIFEELGEQTQSLIGSFSNKLIAIY